MIQDARPMIAAVGHGWGDADDGVSPGSTVLRGARPGREATSSRSWRLGPQAPGLSPDGRPAADAWRSSLPSVVHEFTQAWDRGLAPAAEDYLRRLDPADFQGAVDLIYREYCLAESDGQAPDRASYIARFPRYGEALRRLLDVHGACSPSLLGRLLGPAPASASAMGTGLAGEAGPGLPEAGDSIGPYLLRRELGRGSFARVFLAEQADLANRLVVVKIATRTTREPWLLARARHAHIVEIVSHAVVDDGAFQLICMPFWGGATLADVLATWPNGPRRSAPARAGRLSWERLRPHARERGPATGADLLAALDAVAAPEYPSVHPARPAREILAPLSYDRAIAWVIARLAEALDHASSRDVTHGDVKPSNILLSADGNPMLLDFNLARDGAPAVDPSGRPVATGGTLAYMAPERLRAVVGADPAPDSASASAGASHGGASGPWDDYADLDTDLTGCPRDNRPAGRESQAADIYSLGMVLVEALSGRPPIEAPMPGGGDSPSASRPARVMSTARAYAAARERPARALLRDFEAASGRRIAPALRAILGRCLDPDPARRYGRALLLAEDLDRWRTDRPLAYADEPFWGQAVPRWLRVKRRMLIVAAGLFLAVGLSVYALSLLDSNRLLDRDFRADAQGMLARQWDDAGSGAFIRTQRRQTSHLWTPEDLRAFEVARRALGDYQVLGPGDVPAARDWRLGDSVRYLPPADREDLELWLMERAYRYCRVLEDRPDSPADWRRALEVLDRVGGNRTIRAFATLRDRLAARLGNATSPIHTVSAPAWLDEHLLGFVAECESEAPSPAAGDRDRRTPIERALEHYERVLALRPGSFWGHYRAAAACFGVRRPSDAARHLAACLERRPGNVSVQMQLAGCLFALRQYPEVLALCDQALERAPSHAELYRTRAYARAASGQTGGLIDELRHFEMYSRILPRSFWSGADPARALEDARLIASGFAGPIEIRAGAARRRGREGAVEVDPEELYSRAVLAAFLRQAEQFPLAGAEAEKILVLQPDYLPARMMRAEQAIAARQLDAARSELDVVLAHPGLEDSARADVSLLETFFSVTTRYLMVGRPDDALRMAERARDLAGLIPRDVDESHFNLARVHAVLGASRPSHIEDAAGQLHQAFVEHPKWLKKYQEEGRWFDPVRTRIDATLGRMEDPAEVRRRTAEATAKTRVAGR